MSENDKFRNEPLIKGKMSVRKLRKSLRKHIGICEVSDILESFLTQFSKLELLWFHTEIEHLKEKYNFN